MNAIEVARALYQRDGKDFDKVLEEHLNSGIVICSPLWFLMLKAVEIEGQKAWFIEVAAGNLSDIARLVSFELLPFLAFCRVKNGRKILKRYPTERIVKLAARSGTTHEN